MIDQAVARADRFDIPHFHIDFLQFPLARLLDVPTVTTLHGRLDLPDLAPFHSSVAKAPLVSISDSRRAPMPPVAWAGRFPHGLPKDPLPFSPGGEERREEEGTWRFPAASAPKSALTGPSKI